MAPSSGQRLAAIILFLAFLSGGGVLGYRVMKEYPSASEVEKPGNSIEKTIVEEPLSTRPLVTTEKIPLERLNEREIKKIEEALKININTADVEELDKIPYIGKKTAQYIIDARPYKSIEDITKSQGVGETRFEKIKDYITVSGEGIRDYVKGYKASPASVSPEKPEVKKKTEVTNKTEIVKIDTDGDGIPDTYITRSQ